MSLSAGQVKLTQVLPAGPPRIDGDWFRSYFGQQWRLLIIGVNQLCSVLASMAQVLDINPDAYTAIVAVTHDPKLDDMALLEALKSDAFYVGALGSNKNQEKRRERMRMFDLSESDIASLRGPAGLTVGSRTPAEIAIAILAELIQVGAQQLKDGISSTRDVSCAA